MIDPEWLADARTMHLLPALDPAVAPQPDASDPAQAKAAQRDQRLAERGVSATIAEMMAVQEVRGVVYRWLSACRAFASHDFPPGAAIDPLQLARNAAHREVAQFILADLHRAAAEQYLVMLQENQGA